MWIAYWLSLLSNPSHSRVAHCPEALAQHAQRTPAPTKPLGLAEPCQIAPFCLPQPRCSTQLTVRLLLACPGNCFAHCCTLCPRPRPRTASPALRPALPLIPRPLEACCPCLCGVGAVVCGLTAGYHQVPTSAHRSCASAFSPPSSRLGGPCPEPRVAARPGWACRS